MIKGMLDKIDKIYVSLRSIDIVAIKNPKSYILANLGNENEILKLAVIYLNEGYLDACLKYLSKIDAQSLLEKDVNLAEYWSLCFDLYFYKSTYDIHFKDYFETKNYNFKWYLIKKAISDDLIRGQYQITQALAKVEINEQDAFDFFKFVFNKIKDINEIYNILYSNPKFIKNAILYGYSNGFLKLDDLLAMAKANNEFAAAIAFLLQNKQLIKTNSNNTTFYDIYSCKPYEAGDSYAKFLLAASVSKAKGETPSIDYSHNDTAEPQANHDLGNIIIDKLSSVDCIKSQSSQKVALSYAISHDTFIKAQQDYLINRGFFSSQSAATQKVISKASRTDITDQKRFHMLKKYSEKKSNFGRTFWSTIVCHFSHMFIDYDKNNHEASHILESSAKLTKPQT